MQYRPSRSVCSSWVMREPIALVKRKKKYRSRLGCYTSRRLIIAVACCFGGREDRSDHLRSFGRSSTPQSSSISVYSFSCFIPMLKRSSAIEIPNTTYQTTSGAIPKVFLTSPLSSPSRAGITGIVSNAISTGAYCNDGLATTVMVHVTCAPKYLSFPATSLFISEYSPSL